MIKRGKFMRGVERWALDEVPLSGELVRQIIEWLYRENRFCCGNLKIGNKLIGPVTLTTPTLAAVNVDDDVRLHCFGQAVH
jgi:poly(3-hydroxyalkanoate) synthetase